MDQGVDDVSVAEAIGCHVKGVAQMMACTGCRLA